MVLAVAVGLAACGDDDGGDGGAPTPGPSTTTTTAPAPVDASVMWPFPGAGARYGAPTEAARSFATEFLRFDDPVVEEFRQGDARSGEVPIRPRGDGPVTTILVRQVGAADDWSVLGAVTETIDVTTPTAGEEIGSPVRVAGRAVAFEGTVQVEVRADGGAGPIGAGFVTGGGDEMRPFEGAISFETSGARYGAIVFFTESAEDGKVWQATAVRVALRSTDIDVAACGSYRPPRPRLGAGQMEVKAYFTCDASESGNPLRAVYRAQPERADVLRAALEVLLAGPTAEERAAKLDSWFSDATRDMLRSVAITDGNVIVDFDDFRPVIPNASASAGSDLLLSQLDATVFQFRSVASVEYRIEGSCADFPEWLQYGGCDPRTRPPSPD
ncbi:MAG TPA: Gmad2 immunoglobulin-like domain-containing protein [Acidimicrobiales bacterium]